MLGEQSSCARLNIVLERPLSEDDLGQSGLFQA